ncbi:MAG: hypothetical protein D4R38_01680 [Dehalococcoidia bacterium]|nr:MAG: hypothetical protein D4R38_01680 [Dehalococcoidia bacterium]
MLFTMLLAVLGFMIGLTAKNNKSFRDMLGVMNSTYVIMTKDGKRGRRYVIRNGKYSSDTVLKDYDLALVFENADIGFKTLALGGDTGLQVAMNNYNLKLAGNQQLFNSFGILIAISMGMMKRK